MLNPVDLSRYDLNLLVLFAAVMQEKSVVRAAAALNLTPSAVSHGLGRLRRLLNDPLFLKVPKGVAPTARALELSAAVSDILARVGTVISGSVAFDPATSTRHFTIGAPDGLSAVMLPGLAQHLRARAPRISLGIVQILPSRADRDAEHIWRTGLAALDERAIDAAILPTENVPARFYSDHAYREEFAVAARAGHPFLKRPTLDHYCRCEHVVVSTTGDLRGHVDVALAAQGRSRRVVLSVPGSMLALSVAPSSDLLAALPRSFIRRYRATFGVGLVPLPVAVGAPLTRVIANRAAMQDAAVSWLVNQLGELASQGFADPGDRRSAARA